MRRDVSLDEVFNETSVRVRSELAVSATPSRELIKRETIDQVSQGRFLFGIGGGWNRDEMEDHGTVYATRFKRVRESIEAMKEIWTKEGVEYQRDRRFESGSLQRRISSELGSREGGSAVSASSSQSVQYAEIVPLHDVAGDAGNDGASFP